MKTMKRVTIILLLFLLAGCICTTSVNAFSVSKSQSGSVSGVSCTANSYLTVGVSSGYLSISGNSASSIYEIDVYGYCDAYTLDGWYDHSVWSGYSDNYYTSLSSTYYSFSTSLLNNYKLHSTNDFYQNGYEWTAYLDSSANGWT